jgi:hypothetical protein
MQPILLRLPVVLYEGNRKRRLELTERFQANQGDKLHDCAISTFCEVARRVNSRTGTRPRPTRSEASTEGGSDGLFRW